MDSCSQTDFVKLGGDRSVQASLDSDSPSRCAVSNASEELQQHPLVIPQQREAGADICIHEMESQ